MAWRPTRYLMEGELDNTVPGRVTGWMRFAGMSELVSFDLRGDFHRDIRGAKLRLLPRRGDASGRGHMDSFASLQTGDAGDITAGLPPQDYVGYPYVEWYGPNGRVVVELGPDEVEVLGDPLPWEGTEPVDRERQNELLAGHVGGMATSVLREHGQECVTVVALFHPGHLGVTQKVQERFTPSEVFAGLSRHLTADWGDVGATDRRKNDAALREGGPLVSHYRMDGTRRYFIVTAADRSYTLVLLPGEEPALVGG